EPGTHPLGDAIERRAGVRARRSRLAGRHQARGAPCGVGGNRRGPRLQRLDDRVDFPPRIAQPLFEPLIEPATERLLAIAQVLIARRKTSGRLLDRLPLARDEPSLVLQPLQFALDPRQLVGPLRSAFPAVLLPLLDE